MSGQRWAGMTPEHAARLRRMTEGLRDRVLERAALIAEATGCGWEEADAQALAGETGGPQRTLFGGEP